LLVLPDFCSFELERSVPSVDQSWTHGFIP
jgi:hypothetical protein